MDGDHRSDRGDRAELNAIVAQYFPQPYPARTAVHSNLGEVQIELDVVFALEERAVGPRAGAAMDLTTTRAYADELGAAIAHAISAHTHFPNTPRNAIRYWDEQTPYVIHPIWCAMTLLSEPGLSAEIRYPGAIALLWHDILEDTRLALPEGARPQVRELVQEMTFSSMDEELERLWERSDTTKLLKLYDKVSQFLDGTWLSDARWNRLVAHTRRIEQFVAATYGELNIVRLSRTLAQPR